MHKKIITSFFLLVAFFVFSPSDALADSASFDQTSYSVATSTNFDLVTSVQNLTNADTVDLKIKYDPTVITYQSFTEGIFTDPNGWGVLTSANIINGMETRLFSIPCDQLSNGTGTLITITFTASSTPGNTDITMEEFTIYDPSFNTTTGATGTPASVVAGIPDTEAPVISNTSPSGTLTSGTTETTLSFTTDENAVCHYSPSSNTPYATSQSMTITGTTTHSTTITGLSNGHNYTYYVRCQDDSGNSNSSDTIISFSTEGRTSSSGSSGGGGSSSSKKDNEPPKNVSVTINSGYTTTYTDNVVLTLTAEDVSTPIKMQITNTGVFSGLKWITYSKKYNWKLSGSNGTKNVFVRFKDSKGNISKAVFDSILLQTHALNSTGYANKKVTVNTHTPTHASGRTISRISSNFRFSKNIGIGMSGDNVKKLQQKLRGEGFFTYPTNTGYFGSITQRAVKEYQRRHGIIQTGFVGPLTRSQLNKKTEDVSLRQLINILITLDIIPKDKIALALSTIENL